MAKKFDVAVMHDFFVDRLVHAKSLRGLLDRVAAKAAEGGGGIHGVAQQDLRGGNAVNLAHALARLGLRTLLITHSDRAHLGLLQQSFEGLDAEVRVKPIPAGLTVAFEEDVNVMLGEGGGASDFGPGLLDARDWRGLERSRIVCSVNWAANKHGTQLLLALRKRLGEEKTIYMAPADFRDRRLQFRDLLLMVSKRHIVDWMSMNQYEATASAEGLGIGSDDLGDMCQALAGRLGVVFDLHTEGRSYSSEGTRVASAPVRKVSPKRLTGAGDVWDAGAIYGRLKGMDEVPRLEFANRAAGLYLKSEQPVPPTLADVIGS